MILTTADLLSEFWVKRGMLGLEEEVTARFLLLMERNREVM